MAAKKTPVAKAAAEADAPGFEQALERLETIVDELEGGELTLEESLARYEEGMRLSRRLTQQLDEAERRIERLVDSDGGPVTEPLDLELKPADDPGGEGELPF
ncbi:MAG: exodeoxyribonuclease VII small subunit [Candidatus Eisenbacteria bacterium]